MKEIHEMLDIFVVIGMTGEYDDRQEWVVCAYADEDLAKKHVILADAWAKLQQALYQKDLSYWSNDIDCKNMPQVPDCGPYDEHFKMDYTGTNYKIERTVFLR